MERTRLTTKEAAEYLRCSDSYLSGLKKQEKLKQGYHYYNIGNRSIYFVSKLDEWMQSGGTKKEWENE
jgi:hypothetical protein